ncbi:alpha/beta-hydrolase [Morchella conica CCBAS932]|uniref:Alpha/beta-hydrolase n=2 Tax=Morchella sect. Distantes TaxID=1051054 RepID=A0A3N4KBP0_9PEZI|nr:alpha/beta-hydrolase [Morchella conica CCBAS932]
MFIPSPDGMLEILVALPASTGSGSGEERPPLLFVHGGFGSATCYINFLPFFASHGHPAYSLSLRGHGASHHPGFWKLYWTTKHTLALDIATAITHIRHLHNITYPSTPTPNRQNGVILCGHSSGGGLSQYLISRSLETVGGLITLAAVPGFGSYGVYYNWFVMDPWFAVRMYFRDLFHPRSPLSSTTLVHRAFLGAGCPTELVKEVEEDMAETESMMWPLGMMMQFVDPRRVVGGVAPALRCGRKVLVVAGSEDRLMGVRIMAQLAAWYRSALECVSGRVEEGTDVVRFEEVKGSGHHLMRDVAWRECAGVMLEWLQK